MRLLPSLYRPKIMTAFVENNKNHVRAELTADHNANLTCGAPCESCILRNRTRVNNVETFFPRAIPYRPGLSISFSLI